ncbi:CoA ester lyase [uncultured Luteimonas sp.]|uniref:HpcH/HpaI aldolase/citrate lyase family protein n=1 Tax=uncultured Luteimonas sp. TaxID=453144 RepID=UPI0026048743|nr:CoA ester lyase [uncultured Luteimonas sp.]
MRSKLFVPGARPDLFAKAWAGAADAVSFDLEDAVAEDRKAAARADVAAFLAGRSPIAGGKLAIVRVNAVDSAHFAADMQALAPVRPDLINLPKIESPEQVQAVGALLERLEGGTDGPRAPRLLLNIETPRGLRRAAAIAAAHPRVAGLQLGLGDLFEPYGVGRDGANVHAVMFDLAMAAAEAGVFACDGAWPALDDDAGFEREARMAQRLGFVGKSCIHPRQVPLANAVFAIDPDELARARDVVAAADAAGRESRAVFAVAGRMIDAPYLQRARNLVEAAARRGDSAGAGR